MSLSTVQGANFVCQESFVTVLWVCAVGKVGHIHMVSELTGSSYQQLVDTVVTLCMQMACLCLQPQTYETYSILSPNCMSVKVLFKN